MPHTHALPVLVSQREDRRRVHNFGPYVVQCCQMAEILAKKLKRGRRKKKLAERICGRILAEFYQKGAEKGPQKIFKRSSLFLAMITAYNVHQDEIKFDF
jgi:hypothetical protein